MFIDRANIYVKAGNGGNGAITFHREKYIERGGPSGGNGGKGGDIIFIGDSGLNTLLDFRFKKKFVAENGENGAKEKRFGKYAPDLIIKVPVGTIIYDADTNEVLGDINTPNQPFTLLEGGRGGKGNACFATSRNQVPKFAENGEVGKELNLRLELKLLADVGLVGFPSVGKSTLLSAVTSAKPEIASYHFTTLKPQLGVVSVGNDSFVMADLPGLIEGASKGKGLGLQFLKHIERCRVIIHVIDISSEEGRDPYQDYLIIQNELKEYGLGLEKRPMVIAANKMDDEGAILLLENFKEKVKDVEIFPISALTRTGLDKLLYRVNQLVKETPSFTFYNPEKVKVYKFKDEVALEVIKEKEDLYSVKGSQVEKYYQQTNFSTDEGMNKFLSALRSLGVEEELKKKGIKDGDTVKIYDIEFDYYE